MHVVFAALLPSSHVPSTTHVVSPTALRVHAANDLSPALLFAAADRAKTTTAMVCVEFCSQLQLKTTEIRLI